jgi:hypothetical protein
MVRRSGPSQLRLLITCSGSGSASWSLGYDHWYHQPCPHRATGRTANGLNAQFIHVIFLIKIKNRRLHSPLATIQLQQAGEKTRTDVYRVKCQYDKTIVLANAAARSFPQGR